MTWASWSPPAIRSTNFLVRNRSQQDFPLAPRIVGAKEDKLVAAYLTNADIARHLDLPESTVRYYRDRFVAYLPMVGEGRNRRYQPEALEVFRVIAEILRNNGTATDVEAALSRMFPRNSSVPSETQQQDATTQQQSAFPPIEAFQALHVAVQEQAVQLRQLTEEVRQLRAQLESRDHALVTHMRDLLTERRPRSFWERLFGAHHSVKENS